MKKKVVHFFENFFEVIERPDMAILPGQLAFFFVLSMVPILTLIAYGASAFNLSFDLLGQFLRTVFSDDIAKLVMPGTFGGSMGIQFFISLFVAFYIASNGADSVIVTSNSIYGIKNKNYFKRRIKALIMTFVIVVLFIFILLVPIFGDKIVELIRYAEMNADVADRIAFAFKFLQGPVSWFVMFIFIKLLYTLAPDKKLYSNRVNYGAIFTTVLWVITTAIYSYYIAKFARYDVFYGGFANIGILMLWVYMLAYIFVIGMALNQKEEVLELEKTGQIDLLAKGNNKK